MEITIFLDVEEANFLRLMIPAASPASDAISRAFNARNYWSAEGRDVIVNCDYEEANELLRYAQSCCDSATDSIRRGFRLAHLRATESSGESQRYR
jgi:hypothetical protein